MRIARIKIFSYEFDFKKPLLINQHVQAHRQVLYVVSEMHDGSVHIAEVSPFFEVHSENLGQCVKQLMQIAPLLTSFFSDSLQSIEEFSASLKKKYTLYPSVLFATELILIQIYAASKQLQLPSLLSNEFFSAQPQCQITINALVYCASLIEDLKQLYADGFRTFKIKLWGDPKVALDWFSQLENFCWNDIKFRFDANHRWSRHELKYFLKQLPSSIRQQLTYIEDPCCSLEANVEFFQITQVPYALDIDSNFQFKTASGLCALVCKPSRYGGVFDFVHLLKWSLLQDLYLIVSSSFESDFGLLSLAQLALINKNTQAHGLGTGHYFLTHKLALNYTYSHLSIEQIEQQRETLKKSILQHGRKIYEFCETS